MSYFALNDIQDRMAARASDLTAYRLPSFGTFATSVEPDYYFGVPRNVRFPGVLMDIDYLYNQVTDHDNVHDDVVTFMRATGPRSSALEHLVPEQLFSTEDNPAEGISAVKAIALAQADGQRVYTITSGNLDAALTAVNASTAIESEIRNAVNAGKEVTIHQSLINHYGWQGHGYIIIDPETGAGAYKISGGANGGSFTDPIKDMLLTLFSLAKDMIVSLVDDFRLSFIDALYSIYTNGKFLAEDCSGTYFGLALAMTIIFTAMPLVVFALFPIWYGFVLGVIMTYAIDGMVSSWAGLCRHNP